MDVLRMINKKCRVKFFVYVGILAAAAFWPVTASAQYSYSNSRMNYSPTRYVQATVGIFDTYSRGRETEASTPVTDGERSFDTFGFVSQLASERGDFQYGMEVGAQVGLNSNSGYRLFLAGRNSQVRISSEQWLGDFSLGGFVSLRPVDWLRVYASAGPALYWGRVGSPDYYYDDASDGNRLSVDLTGEEWDLTLAPYARFGLEVTINRKINLGISVRRLQGELDFDRWGRTELNEPAYMLTIGYHY